MKNCTFTLQPHLQTNGATITERPGYIRKVRKAQRSIFLHGGGDLRLALPYTAASINRIFPYLKPISEKVVSNSMGNTTVLPVPTPASTPAPVSTFVPPAKLTFEHAQMIRDDAQNMSVKELATKWNKGETTIRDILKFRTFKAASITA